MDPSAPRLRRPERTIKAFGRGETGDPRGNLADRSAPWDVDRTGLSIRLANVELRYQGAHVLPSICLSKRDQNPRLEVDDRIRKSIQGGESRPG